MTELTADQAIQTLRGLPEDRQRAILARLSPEAKQGIMAKLRAPAAITSRQPDAATRFGAAAAAPVTGAAAGAYHAITDPAQGGTEKAVRFLGPGALFLKRMLVDPAIAQGKEAIQDASGGRYSEAAGHGLAAMVPGIGPAAAQFAETEGKEVGAGDYAGAAGTAVGNAAVVAGPKIIGKGAEALRATSEGMRRGATGTGTGATKELVKKTEVDNAAEVKRAGGEREKTLAANRAADEKTMLERGKVEEHNAGLAEKNAAGQSEAEQVKAQVARRAEAQKELEGISSNMDVAVEKARHDALDIGNKKYSGVNEKLNHLPADMEGVHELYQDAAGEIGDVQAEPPILRRLGKSLEKGDLLTYKDQQALYSELGRELSKGTLPGSTYHAYNILHEGIGEDMQRMADSQGPEVGAELTDARKYWSQMKKTFGKSSDVINNRASKAVNAANPKLLKSQASDYRIRLLSSFDPKIGEMANRANALRQEIDSLPKKEAAPSTATRKDYSEPNPTKPVEKPNVKKVGEEEVRGAKTKALERRVQSIRHRGEWIATGAAGFQVLHNVMTGNFGAVPGNVLEGGIAVAGVEGITRILENPYVVKLLTEPTAKDIAQIPPEMRGDFPAILKAAKAKGIRVDPRITAVLGITALNGAKAKKLQEISDQYRQAAQ